MKITCLIDNLASGGAQRQLCCLAILLKKENWDVKIVSYYPEDFFLPMLEKNGISHQYIEGSAKWMRIHKIRKELRNGGQDVVLSYLRIPNLLAEIAALPRRHWGLVVSERSGWRKGLESKDKWRSRLHALADIVVTNSNAARNILEDHCRHLQGKTRTIYNYVDLDLFSPSPENISDETVKYLVVGRVSEEKNIAGLLDAYGNARESFAGFPVMLDWYGDTFIGCCGGENGESVLYQNALKQRSKLGLDSTFRFHPPTEEIVSVYRNASAIVMPSFFEGMPNVVCEAMACGKPILMSRVGDAEELVHEGKNGFLFDPYSREEISDKLIMFARLSKEEKASMGRYSRMLAEKLFTEERFLKSYEEVLTAAATRSQKS